VEKKELGNILNTRSTQLKRKINELKVRSEKAKQNREFRD
jgi:hypothetical protein